MKAAIEYLEYRLNGLKNAVKRPNLYPKVRAADKVAIKEIKDAIKLLNSKQKSN